MILEAQKTRELILKASHQSGHGHIPTCFSIVEVLLSAYRIMHYDPQQPHWAERDIFILSKGHAALGLYSVLAQAGFFPTEDLVRFGAYNSCLGCHADRHKIPGVEWGTGSLGHGICAAVGMALGYKIQKTSQRVYVLIGDGESNEGSVWEALMVAAHQKLNNLTIILDNNRSQGRCLPIDRPLEKLQAFGFDTVECDGHDQEALEECLQRSGNQPHAIVAHTCKGYGCSTLERDVYAWHRRSPNTEELEILLGELHASAV
ncbi:transketolase [Planctomycetota bacterium]